MTPFDYDPSFAVAGGQPLPAGTPWRALRLSRLGLQAAGLADRRNPRLPRPAERGYAVGGGRSQQSPSGAYFTSANGAAPLTPDHLRPELRPNPSSAGVAVRRVVQSFIGERAAVERPLHGAQWHPGPDKDHARLRCGGNWLSSVADVDRKTGVLPREQHRLADPDDPIVANQPAIDREVYFVPRASITVPTSPKLLTTTPPANRQFFPSIASAFAVAPGTYALIGSGEANATYQNGHPKRTYIGFRVDGNGAGNDNTRYIDLDPNSVQTLLPPLPVQNQH